MNEAQKTVLIIGTCDSKGEEILLLKNIVLENGLQCLVLDLGLLKDPTIFAPDITRDQLSKAAGVSLEELIAAAKEGRYEVAVEKLAQGSETIIQKLYKDRKIDGVLAIGGSMGTAIGLRALRALPVGFPKVLISTVAISEYIHPHFVKSDMVLVQPISDFFGVNQWSIRDLKRAAVTICSIVREEEPMEQGNWVGITAIGWSAACASAVKDRLEKENFKVAVAHAVSMQCGIMEQLISQGVIKGMIDLCHFEILHEVSGAACHSRKRLSAAVDKGIPMILAPNTMGTITMNSLQMPEFAKQGRFTVEHNEILGTAKATVEEMAKTAEIICTRLNRSKGRIAYVIPSRGFCDYDQEGKMYYDPEGRAAFISMMQKNLKPEINLEVLDCHWNDDMFVNRICELSVEYFNADILETVF